MVICRNITVVHPMLIVVIIHNIIEAALSFFMGIISARLYKLNRIIDKKVDRQVHRIVVVMFIIMYALTLIFTVMQNFMIMLKIY